ncbi:Down-regulated-in-metastasis protein [Kalmanozyma brasiliensis GHG001]|uniref:Putative U3 snoRNP protein Utp20p n=1 Tax=Kalmanozyma brasiliensis (strain GHG001) TaxID=1365824 RepID=V5EV40_KALBG|nr:Down-regulated-in-metastasis protein [Kalmanozyma brasiliensis GHG001]EST09315.1 Down-regulated-in-metastasis protein [Kalmanozyma brasiliensis GHG001]
MAPSSSNSTAQPRKAGKKLSREQQRRKADSKASKVRRVQLDASGNQASAKQKTLKQINKNADRVTTRFRYASFNQRLQDVHLAPAAISASTSYRPYSGLDAPLAAASSSKATATSLDLEEDDPLDQNDEDASSSLHAKTSFSHALQAWTDLNLSNAFHDLYRQLNPITQSLPQLIHHRSAISTILTTTLSARSQWLAWDAALDLLPRLAKDLGSEFLPIYPPILQSAVHVTTTTKATTNGDERAAANLVERGFQSAAWILKAVSPFIVSKELASRADQDEETADSGIDIEIVDAEAEPEEVDERTRRLIETWTVIRPYLGWKPITAKEVTRANDDDNNEEEEEDDDAASTASDQGDAIDEETAPAKKAAFVNTDVSRISPFTRRFASEAFAHLLRKTRGPQLQSIASLILSDLETMLRDEDRHPHYRRQPSRRPSVRFSRGIAGIWVEGCKSLERRLHSKCISLLSVLLRPAARSAVESASADYGHLTRLILGRLTITALVHHCNALHFAPVLEFVSSLVDTNQSRASRDNSPAQDIAHLTESVEWLACAVGVRKGSRVADAAKPALFALLLRLSPLFQDASVQASQGGPLRTSLVSLLALSIPIGRLQDLLGPGIKLVDSVAPVPTSSKSKDTLGQRQALWPEFSGLVEALAQPALEWSGFKQFVLPSVLTSTAETVASTSTSSHSKDQAFTLLERLEKLGQLDDVRSSHPSPALVRWSKHTAAEIETRLDQLVALFCATTQKAKGSKAKSAASRVLADQSSLEPLVPALRLSTVPKTASAAKFGSQIAQLLLDGLLSDAFFASEVQVKTSYDERIVNPALLVGLAFESLAILQERSTGKEAESWAGQIKDRLSIEQVVRCASWHRGTLRGLSKYLASCPARLRPQLPQLVQVIDPLSKAVMSSDPIIRLAALEILSIIEAEELGAESVFVGKLVEVERTPLTVETIRDRNVRMRSVGRDLGRAAAVYKAADVQRFAQRDALVLRYLVANLKVNLRPVWSEAIKAVSDIIGSGQRQLEDTLFGIAIAELEAGRQLDSSELRSVPADWTQINAGANGHVNEDEANSAKADEVEPDRILRDESDMAGIDDDKQFQDVILLGRRKAVRSCIQHARISSEKAGSSVGLTTTLQACIDAQQPDARLDLINYRHQILKLLGENALIVERNNARFVHIFFRDAGPRNLAGVLLSPLDDDDEEEEEEEEDEDNEITSVGKEEKSTDLAVMLLGKKDRQAQLNAYLEVLGKLKNPKALSRTAELHSYLLSLCATAEVSVQKLALEAILTWKDEAVIPYASKLKDLLEAGNFRDTLTTFTISSDSNVVQPYHRPALMPLVIRLLFGALLSRRGNRTSGAGQRARRGAVLGALADIGSEELVTLVDLMLAPFGDQAVVPSDGADRFDFVSKSPVSSTRRQVGYLTLLGEVVKQIGTNLLPYWDRLISVALNLTYHAHRAVVQVHIESSDATSAVETSKPLTARTSRARLVRQAGYKRLCDFFGKPQAASAFDWNRYLPAIFAELVTPRLELLKVESSQSPSALLELFHVWTSQPETIPLLGTYDNQVLPSVFAILAAPNVKPSAIGSVLDIAERVLAAASAGKEAMDITADVSYRNGNDLPLVDLLVRPHASVFLNSVSPLIEQASAAVGPAAAAMGRDDLLRRQISLLAALSPFVTAAEDASHLIKLLSPMMRKSNFLVPERTKTELLAIFERLLSLIPEFQDKHSDLYKSTFAMFSSLFSLLRSADSRRTLSAAFNRCAEVDMELDRVAKWCTQLNALSKRRVEERDFDQLFAAFDSINGSDVHITAKEWQPLVHNMLFLILDPEELSVRSNANASLVKFITQTAGECDSGADGDGELMQLFLSAVWPGLKKAVRNRSELVRRDVLAVMSSAAQNLPKCEVMAELSGLLGAGDAEVNFFNNIHHIQLHRRTRAVKRLPEQAAKGGMKSRTISDILAPVLGHFLMPGSVELNDHNLITEVITSLGQLAGQLTWGPYNALLWTYLRLANKKGSSERVMVRTAMAILDNFHFGMEEEAILDGADVDDDQALDEGADAEEDEEARIAVQASRDGKEAERVKILDAVTSRLLPRLMAYLEQKDETEDSTRLPIAVGVVRVAQCLPAKQRQTQISKLLKTLSNVFRSKAQDTRDLARETACKVMSTLGASFLPEFLREMRRSLMRGPQKAVMAFAVHSVLTHLMTSKDEPLTSLDQGAKEIIEIAVEDIFGATADDRESIGSKTTYREVKHSKSMDTFEQVSRIVTPNRMAEVLQPLRDILQQTEIPKTVRQVEECLRRISSGIPANPQFDSNRFLSLCATLIRRDAVFLQARKPETKAASRHKSATLYNYSVFLKRKDVEEGATAGKDHYSRNAHKFVAFGLEMLVTSLRRERFDFQDEEVLAKLNAMVNIVGEAAYANESSVLELSLRAIAQIVKVPVSRVDKALPVFIKQIFGIIHQYGSPQSQIVQTAFRTLTAILRECKQASLSETHLSGLLKLISPDLEEPAVQTTLFALLRAIVSRRLVVSEVYDTMDKVAEMMVTNQSDSVRDLCRSTYLQFLLDYPQGKQRLRNQIGFLAKNLAYEHESGRLSVLEITDAILNKFGDELLQEYAEMLFVALAMMLANDSSSKCREKAAVLIRTLLRAMTEAQQDKTALMMDAWSRQEGKAELARVGVQMYGLLLEALSGRGAVWADKALQVVTKVLVECADDLESLESSDGGAFGFEDMELDWQLPYHSLQTLGRITTVIGAGDAKAAEANDAVRRLLLFPHKWVRISSSRILGGMYALREPKAPIMVPMQQDPIASLPALVDAAKKSCLQLRSDKLDDTLALQVVKNLVWIGRSFALFPVDRPALDEVEEHGAAEEGSKKRSLNGHDDEANEDDDDEGKDGDEDASEEDEEDEGENDEMDDETMVESAQSQQAAMDAPTAIATDPLRWLVSRLSFQARLSLAQSKPSHWTIAPSSILRFFAALSSSLPADLLPHLLPLFLSPIIRLVESPATAQTSQHGGDDLKALAIEVQSHLQALVDVGRFNKVYSILKRRQQAKREQRKTDRLMRGIQNPEAQARRNETRNRKNHQARKRRNQVNLEKREAGGSGKTKRARRD